MGALLGALVGYFQDADIAREKQARKKQEGLALIADWFRRIEAIPQKLNQEVEGAKRALDRAQGEFNERVYDEFWTAIQEAVTCLARYEEGVENVADLIRMSEEKVRELDLSPSERPAVPLVIIPDVVDVTKRLRALVLEAKKDINFALIYQQWQTNKILVYGFATVGQALSEINSRLASSIERLTSLGESVRASADKLQSSVDRLRKLSEHEASQARLHREKLENMLDNIQRGRKP